MYWDVLSQVVRKCVLLYTVQRLRGLSAVG